MSKDNFGTQQLTDYICNNDERVSWNFNDYEVVLDKKQMKVLEKFAGFQ